jgi:glycosyltransferase involved in cell wall biosynthesis
MYLNASDALIFTSFSEGSPNVIKEAMAANTPIISVAVGDTKEVISNAQNCYIVPDNAYEMAEKLSIILKDGRRSNGRELISHLEISKVARKLEAVYYNILENIKRTRNEK